MPDTLDRARALIQARLTELATEAGDLERALTSLGERAVPRRHRGRPKKSAAASAKAKTRAPRKPKVAKRAPTASVKGKPRAARKRKTAKRSPRGQRREQLLAAVQANPGGRPSELARQIGVSANQAHSLIAKARKDKLLAKKGKGYALKG